MSGTEPEGGSDEQVGSGSTIADERKTNSSIRTNGPLPGPRKIGRSGRPWGPVIIIAFVLILLFSIVNLINVDVATSLTVLFSTMITTFPLVIIVVVGVYFVFVGGRGKKKKAGNRDKNESRKSDSEIACG